jgi:hypothetical protein
VLLLQSAYPPPRYGIRETASGTKWAGYREVLGRCLTQALLEHTCWLLHLAVGQIPNGPFIPPSATPRDQNNNVLPLYSRCGAMQSRACACEAHGVRPAPGTCASGCGLPKTTLASLLPPLASSCHRTMVRSHLCRD